MELVNGLFPRPNKPRKLNKLLVKQLKDISGKNSDLINPKRHYKKGVSKSKVLPKYFQVGTMIGSASDFFLDRLTKKERKANFADTLLSDQTLGQYRKRKAREIEEQNRPGGNEKWKIRACKGEKIQKHLFVYLTFSYCN